MADISTADDITYSFVIPVHNEEEVLGELVGELGALRNRLDGTSEVIFVDDGSADDSWSILTTLADLDPSISLVRLSRNFGHQIAVTAGLEHSTGECAVIMDADLQDPPQTVLEMSRRWREGYDVVFGVRTDRQQDTRFKRVTAAGFYRCLNALSDVDIPAQVGDFRLIDRAVIDAIAEMPERNRYVRGMFAWLGFRQIGVEYARPERAAGTTSYGLTKMLRLANDGVIGYSKAPIRSITVLGAGLTAVSAAAGAAALVAKTAGLARPPTAMRSAGVAGVQLVALGLIGEYVARIFDESTDRPLYVTQEVRRRLPRQQSHETDPAIAGVERGHDNVRPIRTRQGAALVDTHR
ncbi:glycosyltransferase family 2 protein [Ilumatobacter nonamiensis]|uniref:glycosyltransferase family 2 protein n=1 Tax=Ilumatobacter nonamiensis TaxID=467093 RepID=UPI00034B6A41|nr:glycosyltransferase family 2 protein [Ilumatobacter nonamiensis]